MVMQSLLKTRYQDAGNVVSSTLLLGAADHRSRASGHGATVEGGDRWLNQSYPGRLKASCLGIPLGGHPVPYHSIEDPAKLRRVLEATLLLEADLELPSLLRHIIEEACSMTNARYGALGVLERRGHRAVRVHHGRAECR